MFFLNTRTFLDISSNNHSTLKGSDITTSISFGDASAVQTKTGDDLTKIFEHRWVMHILYNNGVL